MSEQPDFSYEQTGDGRVMIAYRGRVVTTLKGRDADRFIDKCDRSDEPGRQRLMAVATGNFRRGNERDSKNRRP